MYIAVNCPRCGELILANTSNRTRSCPKCGHRAELRTLRVLGRAETPSEAVELMKQIKERKAGSDYTPSFRRLQP